MQLNNLRSVAAIVAAASAAACGGSTRSRPRRRPPPNAKRVDAATAGTLTGKVLFDGPAPANPPIKMSADPVCVERQPERRRRSRPTS